MEGKLNFMLIIIIAILSMAVAFIVIYMVITGGAGRPSAEGKEVQKHEQKKNVIDYKKAVTYAVPEMIVNLKSGGNNPKSIIKIEVGILLEDKSIEEEVKAREIEIKDIIRSTLNSKTGEGVVDNKIDQVAQELLVKFKAMYHEPKESGKILKVLIPSAFVQ